MRGPRFSDLRPGPPPAPPPWPEWHEALPYSSNLAFWYRADVGAWTDGDGTQQARDGQAVALLTNHGSRHDAQQTTSARRPTFREGGLAGYPFLRCAAASQQYFDDLDFTQPSGLAAESNFDSFSVVVVTDNISNLGDFPSVLGSTATAGGKVRCYFREPDDAQIAFVKAQFIHGNIANPMVLSVRSTGGSVRSNLNGAVNSITDFSNHSPTTAIAATQFLRNSGLSSSDGFFNGDIYEFLLFAELLSSENQDALVAHFMGKYGL